MIDWFERRRTMKRLHPQALADDIRNRTLAVLDSGVSQREIERVSGLPQSTISQWVRGERDIKRARLHQLSLLFEALPILEKRAA